MSTVLHLSTKGASRCELCGQALFPSDDWDGRGDPSGDLDARSTRVAHYLEHIVVNFAPCVRMHIRPTTEQEVRDWRHVGITTTVVEFMERMESLGQPCTLILIKPASAPTGGVVLGIGDGSQAEALTILTKAVK